MFEAYTVPSIRDGEAVAIAEVGEDALMYQAARGLAQVVGEHLRTVRGQITGARVVLLAGPGNNGGDGLFAAARLVAQGARAAVWHPGPTVHQAGLAALVSAGGTELEPDADSAAAAIGRADVVIDGLLGIGGHPGLRGEMAALVGLVGSKPPVWTVAVDTPSGVAVDPPLAPLSGADTAAHLEADATVTFGGRKLCHVLEPGRSACGELTLIDIGLPPMTAAVRCWEQADVAAMWPVPGAEDDKYSRGVVGIDTGSERFPGAAVLSTLGALYSGAGFVRYCGADAARLAVLARTPSVTFGTGRVGAWVLGCGWDEDEYNGDRLAARLGDGVPCVIDASALPLLPDWHSELPAECLLTPHAGELARLLGIDRGAVVADPLASARHAALRFGAAVLLKGAIQVVATPVDEPVRIAVPGPAWTAQAGSGDVLAGIAGTLLACGLPAATAGVLAASLQALTASWHPGPYPPDALARRLPATVRRLVAGR
jgi:hydroxyethylthiazole kinase-like uncharacterized protein yjeF